MKLEPYITLGGRGESLYEDRRSEFIGVAIPVTTEDEAAEFIKGIKKQNPAARHNVWAYSLRSGVERYSDDGEPQGSAGVPVLEVLRKTAVRDAAVVVTRYFGGILLGTGGLLRAYSAAAKQAVEDAGCVRMLPLSLLSLDCSYADHQRIMLELPRFGAAVDWVEFGGEVRLVVAVRSENAGVLSARITEMTAGRVITADAGIKYGKA